MNKRPCLLIINWTNFIGGGEIYLANLLPYLADHYKVTVLASKPVASFLRQLKDIEVVSFRIFSKQLEKNLPRNYRLKKMYYRIYFKEFFRRRHFDLVNLHAYDSALVQTIGQSPLVLVIHTRFLVPQEFNAAIIEDFKRIDKVICISQQTKQDLTDRGVQPNKCVVIHSAIDPSKSLVNKSPGKYITWIGRLEEADKNPLLFIKIAEAAKSKRPDLSFRIVGQGSYLAELKECANDRSIKNIEFYGFCPPDKIHQVYKEASILCMTSTSEGLPFVALEAMASCVPVVATKVGGLPELIDSPSTGILVDSFEPEKILKEITALIDEPGKYTAIQKAARQRVENDFSLDSMAQKTSKVYDEILEQT